MEKEIEENIYKRFPSLSNSPDKSRSTSKGESLMRTKIIGASR